MRIVHRITTKARDEVARGFRTAGIEDRLRLSKTTGSFVLEISEDDPAWLQVHALIKRLRLFEISWTTFDEAELANANSVAVTSIYRDLYPQPENSFREATYDLSSYCKTCGVGLVQKANFVLKSEPKWKRNNIFQPFGVHEELFIRVEDWDRTVEEFGLATCAVLRKNGETFEGLMQLSTDAYVDVEVPKRLKWITCEECGRRRYWMMQRGPLPYPKTTPSAHYFKSNQLFGSGHMAFRQLCFSHDLYIAFQERGLRGATFAVCGPYPENLGDPSPGGP